MRVLLRVDLFVLGRVDPGCAWQFRRGWRLADEALGVGVVGGGQDPGAPGPDGCGPAVAAWIEGNRAGKPGRYFRVLNCASEYGLSLETWGREWDWVMPRSASSRATDLEVIEEPRSAWMLSWPRVMPCFAQVAAMSFSAKAADSRVATIQPTNVAAVDVQDHVQVVVGPFRRAVQLGDVPWSTPGPAR